jgi:demethylmenaquinone methyltransferase/2-methoxy-6-polyprenyl-1,4-benzoquinol methylase
VGVSLTKRRHGCYVVRMLQPQKRPVAGPPAWAVPDWPGQAKEQTVQQMFTSIARFYDLNNSLLSFGLHHRWKRVAADLVPSTAGGRAIDVGAGTGDLALLVEKRLGQQGHVVAVDLNAAMLRQGVRKIARRGLGHRIACLRATAERLGFRDASFDAVTTGFCIRNVGDLMQTFSEIRRVLKPGGRLVCLEFSRPVRAWLRALYDWYSLTLLPRIGTLVARDRTGVYRYLPDSIRAFPDQEALKDLLLKAGFRQVEYQNLSGGIVAIHIAVK